eukprot:symbB.v1.2.003254.t1/scaffold157.1/size293134/1
MLQSLDHIAVESPKHYSVTDNCFRGLTALHLCALLDLNAIAHALVSECSGDVPFLFPNERRVQFKELLGATCQQLWATMESEGNPDKEPWLWRDLTPLHLSLVAKNYITAEVLIEASTPDTLDILCSRKDVENDSETSYSALLLAFEHRRKDGCVANCYEGWWMSFASRTSPDIACISAPCPPWSYPNLNSAKTGLLSDHGQLIPEALWRAKVLGCSTVLFENVATLQQHPHWSIIKCLFKAYGWDILWDGILNLSDMIPQNRSRYLAVLVSDMVEHDAPTMQLISSRLSAWPSRDHPTLGSYDAIMQLTPEWSHLAEVPPEHMKAFQDPRMIPSSHDGKKPRMDLETYRLRGPADIFATVMAAYSVQAEFDQAILSSSGLYGTLVSSDRTWLEARYLVAAEAYLLMGGCVNITLPLERSAHFRVLGNAIATPHALIAFFNGLLVYMRRLANVPDVSECFQMFFQHAFRASKIQCKFSPVGIEIQRKGYAESTIPEPLIAPKFVKLILECGHWKSMIIMPENFRPDDAFKMIHAGLATEHVKSFATPCSWDDEVVQTVPLPVELDISHLDIGDFDSDNVLLLNQHCPLIVKRRPHAITRSYGFDIMVGSTRLVINHVVLTSCAGRVLPFHDRIPQVCFVHDGSPADIAISPCLDAFQITGNVMRLLFKTVPIATGVRILEFFRASKIDECLAAIGWTIDLSLDRSRALQFSPNPGVVIMIRPKFGALIMDFPSMQTFLATRLFRHSCPPALTALCDEEKALWNNELRAPHFVHATVKLCNDIIWEGYVLCDTRLGDFSEPWIQAAETVRFFTELRFVVAGRRRYSDCTLAELWDESKSTIKIYLIFPLRGGGSKEDLVLVTKNRLGAFLISQGVTLEDIHAFCPDLIKAVGPTRVCQALDLNDALMTMAMLNDLAGGVKMKMPPNHDAHVRAATKLQQAVRKKALTKQKQLRAHQFRLAEGFFRNEDQSPANILSKFSLQNSGICLMDLDEGAKWLGKSNLVSDELAIVILGCCGDSNRTACTVQLTFPAFNSEDQPVILSGCLHQIGSKAITAKDEKSGHVDLPKSTVVSVTLWRDEWNPSDWQTVVRGPVKFVANAWTKEGHSDFFLGAPWNRFWKDSKGSQCQPENAATVGFFFRTPDASIVGLLRSSGENSIYLHPRTNDSENEPKWLAIWFNQPKSEVMLKAANSSFYLGLIRSTKGYGIRVSQTDFKSAFEAWRPGQQLPDRRHMPLLFKLKPLPKGVTNDELKAWLGKQGWDARALKSLAADTWLVAACAAPPAPFSTFNGRSVLIKPIEKNSRSPTVVLAGTAPKPTGPVKHGVDPFVRNDPWASYTGSAASGPSQTVTTTAVAPTRPIEAPIEARFRAYDDQLQAMKTALHDVQADLKKTNNEAQTAAKRLDGRINSMEATVNKSIQMMSQSFSDNLASALAKQDSQMAAGFSELKAMLEQNTSITSPAKKVPRKTGDGEDRDL